MRRARIILFAVAAVIVLAFPLVLPYQQQFPDHPLHSAMESVQAISVLLLALFLLHPDEDREPRMIRPALGFLAMGVLNIVHAASSPGAQFVLLRALANLAGGVGFALVWLPAPHPPDFPKTRPALITAGAALAVCLLAYLFPSALPRMVTDGAFSGVAVAINAFAGVLFLAGVTWFLRRLYRSGAAELLLFSLIGLFFGLSALTFGRSMLWTPAWWFWHALQLSGSLLVLAMVVRRHLRTVITLKTSLVERKDAENRLKRSYQLIKTIIDSMNDAISLLDVRTFTIVSVNSAFLSEYGFADESEVVGKHCYEITHHRPEVCTAPDDICPLVETVRSGKHASVDHVHYGRNGEKIYAEVSTSPITDENGEVVQVVHVSRDITGRKRAEQEREQLLAGIARSNKELEQFAYVASHDLQEPLRMVSSYVTLLEKKYKGRLDEKADSYIRFAVDGAQRMQKLIEGLLEYSRSTRRGAARATVDLNAVFDSVVSNLAALISDSRADVAREDLPSVSGVEMQLLQLFQNLISNALKFRRPDVPPRIRVSAKRDERQWTLSVSDNGIGIEKDYFARIFEIFQRLHTRDSYPGTGIGLAVCKNIVDGLGGRIWVESAPGQGTTFLFTIPLTGAMRKAA